MRMQLPRPFLAVFVFILLSVGVKGMSDVRHVKLDPDRHIMWYQKDRVETLAGKVDKGLFWHPNWDLLPHEKCGLNIKHARTLTIRNGDTDAEKFPWIVRYYTDGSKNKEMNCAGSIISRKYILTSSHCCEVNNKSGVMPEIHIAPGLATGLEGKYAKYKKEVDYRLTAQKITIHNGYMKDNHGVCLVRLKEPYIQWPDTPIVSPICLPFYDRFDHPQLIRGGLSHMLLAGWGNYTPGVEELPANFKTAELYMYKPGDYIICPHGSARSILCDSGAQKYIGRGDSASFSLGDYGAPLTNYDLKTIRWYLHGITRGERSMIEQTEDSEYSMKGNKYYTFFTRVYDYLSWILDNLEP